MRKLFGSDALAIGLVWLVTIALTAAKLDNELVYDDVAVIETGSIIHDPANIPNLFKHRTMYAQGDVRVRALDTYRPVTLLSFFWDAAISGRRPLSYHVTNLIMHLVCVTLVFRLARALLSERARRYAALGALFFAIAPQLAEAHVWINGRSDLFCTAFGLAAILCWRRALAEPRPPWRLALQLAAGALMLLGLLSKEVLLTLLPLLVWWPAPEAAALPLGRRVRAALPLLLAPLPYLAARSLALRGLHASDPEELQRVTRHLPLLLVDGLRELVSPSRIYLRCLFDEYRTVDLSMSVLAALGLLALGSLALRYRRRAPLLPWCLAWYLMSLAPAALISTPTWAGFGRYLYLPCVGVAIGLTELGAAGFAALERRLPAGRAAPLAALALGGYFVTLGLQLVTVTYYYQNDQTLYAAAYRAQPDAAYSNEGLAAALLDAGETELAIPLFERAAALRPENPRYVRKLFTAYMRARQVERARALIEQALPRFPAELCGDLKALLIATTHSTDPERTIEVLSDCLRYQPDLIDCRRWIPILTAPPHRYAQRYRQAFAAQARAVAAPN